MALYYSPDNVPAPPQGLKAKKEAELCCPIRGGAGPDFKGRCLIENKGGVRLQESGVCLREWAGFNPRRRGGADAGIEKGRSRQHLGRRVR